jgi:ribosomal protein S4
MRLYSRYKNYLRCYPFSKYSLARILNFKRSKWKKLKCFKKKKKYYKEGLILKSFFQRFLDLSISSKKIKVRKLKFKNLKFDKNLSANFINSYFSRLDIFLSKIGLFNSVYEIINALRNKLIYVNYEIITNNRYYLKSGDIIILKDFFSSKKKRKEQSLIFLILFLKPIII